MIDKEKLLVIGADGLIGRALVCHLKSKGKQVIETTRRYDTILENGTRIFFDLGNISDLQLPKGVSIAYICAAISSIESCRKDPIYSRKINVDNTFILAKTLTENGVFVIFPSTNMVYDGTIPYRKTDEPICPTTEYGRQKADTEKLLLTLGDMISIVRLTKIVSHIQLSNMQLFRIWVQLLLKGEVINPFSDIVISPIPLSYVINVLYHIANNHLSGIIQVSGKYDVTYAQVAYHIARRIGANSELVQPINSNDANIQFEVPSYTTLDTTRLCTELGIEQPDVWITIDSMLGI